MYLKYPREGMIPTFLSPDNLSMSTCLGEGKLCIQTVKLRFRIDLLPDPARAEG